MIWEATVADIGVQNYQKAHNADAPLRKEIEEPPLSDHPLARRVLDAWGDLATVRPVGLTVSCLPWDKVMYYAQARYGFDVEQAMYFWDVAHAADMKYLKYLDEKRKSEAPPDKPKPKPRPTPYRRIKTRA